MYKSIICYVIIHILLDRRVIMLEIKVLVKGEDRSYTQKFVCYEAITFDKEKSCKALEDMVSEAVGNFKGDVDEVRVTALFFWG